MEKLVWVASLARPNLPSLTRDTTLAAEIDSRLSTLINASMAGTDVASELSAALRSTPDLQSWTALVLADPHFRPPDLQPISERGYETLVGDGEVADVDMYCCPLGDYRWWRFAVGDDIPTCPTHRLQLRVS